MSNQHPIPPDLVSFPRQRIFFQRTSTPRLGRSLFTGLLAHGIWLSLVLCDTSVYGPGQPVSKGVPSLCLLFKGVLSYWTMSGRIGARKTVGSGWVAPLGLPSAVAMETVGREAIVVDVMLLG